MIYCVPRDHDTGTYPPQLDSTGPGAFSDAIFRYLLVQYGVTPHDLLNMEDGAVIGDVLYVLPPLPRSLLSRTID